MKKNFVKKTLASTLALAMVATATPAAFTTASAAKAPKLNKTSKTLYINENEIGSSFDFNISNKVAGSTYKWTTSNKAVATVNAKNGLTKAGTKTGTATIKCKITFKTKKTKTLSAKVTVKENASKVEITNPVENITAVGENAYDFNSKMTSASGAKATDYRMWEINSADNTAGATIDAKTGVVKTTKTGKFQVRVVAYQNKTKLAANDVVASDWLTVNVNLAVVEAKQVADNKIQLTYNDEVATAPKVSDVVVTNTESKAVSAVKSVSVDSTNKKLVTVTLWGSLTDAKEYEVKVGDFSQKVNASVGAVSTVRIDTATVIKGVASEIKYTLLDANGIDVTNAKKTTSNMEISIKTDKGYKDSENKLTLYNVGDTAEVTVTYHTYKFDNTGAETGKVSGTATVTATDKEAVGNYLKYTLATSTPNFDKDTMVSSIPAGKSYKIYVQGQKSDGSKYTATVGSTLGNSNVTLAKYTSSDSSVLLVNSDGSVYGVKAGTAYIMAYDTNGNIIWSFAVTVQEGTKATALTLSNSTLTVSNKDGLNDTKSTKVVLKDQYNNDFSGKLCALNTKYSAQASGAGVIQPISKPDGATTLPTLTLPEYGNNDLTVSASKDVKAGTYSYLIAVKDATNVRTVLTVIVQDANSIASTVESTYDLVVSKTEVDTTVGKDTNCETYTDVTVKIGEYKNGILVGYVPSSDVKVELTTDSTKGAQSVTTVGNETTVKFASSTDADNVVAKSATGTYKVSASYTFTKSGATTPTTVNLVKLVTVKDSQTAPSVSKEKDTTDVSGTILDAVKACYKIDGMTIIDASVKCAINDAKATTTLPSNTIQIYVESVTAVVPVKDNDGNQVKFVKMAIPVGNTITVTK